MSTLGRYTCFLLWVHVALVAAMVVLLPRLVVRLLEAILARWTPEVFARSARVFRSVLAPNTTPSDSHFASLWAAGSFSTFEGGHSQIGTSLL
jgi:hypothetical protein